MNKKELVNLDKLIGLNKKEILDILGDEFNIPYAKEWRYELKKKSFLFFNEILVLYFDEYDKVKKYKKKIYLNI